MSNRASPALRLALSAAAVGLLVLASPACIPDLSGVPCAGDDSCPTGFHCVLGSDAGVCQEGARGAGGGGGSPGSGGGGAVGSGGGSAGGGGGAVGGGGGSVGGGGGSPGGGGGAGGGAPSGGGQGGGTAAVETSCGDDVDNDADGLVDCYDPDCFNQVCRAAVGVCDLAERCPAAADACPANAYAGNSVVCAPASCAGGSATPAARCTGAGPTACGAVTPVSCNGYACDGAACATTCATDGQCLAGYFCSGSSCAPVLALGQVCNRGAMCASGSCGVYYVDGDVDGYGGPSTATVCGPATGAPPGFATTNTDCNDASFGVHPNATELVADGIDENCDGQEICYRDQDRDGYRTDVTTLSTVIACVGGVLAPASRPAGDCDDQTAAIHPGAAEVPGDGVDQNCDGQEACFTDADGDGYRTTSLVTSSNLACTGAGEAPASMPLGDCCDRDQLVFPGQTAFFPTASACGTFDYDCDGLATPQRAVVTTAPVCQGLILSVCNQLVPPGWLAVVPGCGQTGTYLTCNQRVDPCVTLATASTQSCR
jgi:hypothetical protein